MFSVLQVEWIKLKARKGLWLTCLCIFIGDILFARLADRVVVSGLDLTEYPQMIWFHLCLSFGYSLRELYLFFPSVVALAVYSREYQNGMMQQLVTYPQSRFAIYLGKLLIVMLSAGFAGLMRSGMIAVSYWTINLENVQLISALLLIILTPIFVLGAILIRSNSAGVILQWLFLSYTLNNTGMPRMEVIILSVLTLFLGMYLFYKRDVV